MRHEVKNYNRGKNNPNWRGGKIHRICEICGKEFYIPQWKINKGWGKLCSMECRVKNWTKPKIKKICHTCKKEFYVQKYVDAQGNGKFCSRSCLSISNHLHNKKTGTSIEVKMERELIQRGIVFKKQYPIFHARTIPDFFITPNICIYCDGEYWHNLPNRIKSDDNQNYWLEFYGYKVYRFWEHEINKNVSKCVDKIREIKSEPYRI